MNEEKDLNLTEEFNKILEKCFSLNYDSNWIVLQSETISFYIIKTYLEGNGTNDILSNYLNNNVSSLKLNPQALINKMTEIVVKANNKLTNMIDTNLKSTNKDKYYVRMSDSVEDIFKEAREVMDLIISPKSVYPINTTSYLISALINNNLGNKEDKVISFLRIKKVLSLNEILATFKSSNFSDNKKNSDINDIKKAKSIIDSFENIDSDMKEKMKEFLDYLKGDDDERSSEKEGGGNEKEKDEKFESAGVSEAISTKKVDPNSKTPNLDKFAFDMTNAASEGKYDPVVGRDNEINQMFEVLSCRKKNSCALLGDPGCGKSALVEDLAQRIVNKNCPALMRGKRVMLLDVNALVAGTQFRGQFEQRVQDLLEECTKDKDLILFIDEFHSVLNAGGNTEGSGLGQLIKPALARGEISCIVSTTYSEYTKYVEKDGALKRRFQNIFVSEPSVEETIDILKGLKEKYSSFHRVNYTDEVIELCVKLSDRYIFGRFFPDKAIDIMDGAGALAKLQVPVDTDTVDKLQSELESLENDKFEAIKAGKYEEGDAIMKKTDELKNQIEKEKEKSFGEKDKSLWPTVTTSQVAHIISKLTKIPESDLISSDLAKLKDMKSSLSKEIIGQEEAVDKIITSLQLNSLGLRDPNKPIASFLFLGKTGLGKTYICQKLAEKFFGSKDALITVSMGEMSNADMSATAFKGSSAGYVGYGDPDSAIFEKVRKRPHSVVLFDEVEKANTQVFDMLLNILQEGWTTLGNGQKVSFRNTIIILTGNLGTKEVILRGDGIGFSKLDESCKSEENKKIILDTAKKHFRPEFLNRLTGITVFNDFSDEDYSKIYELELDKVKSRLKERGFNLITTKSVKEKVISSIDKNYGARDLTREISKWIQEEICKYLISSDVDIESKGSSKTIKVDYKKEEIKVSIV